MRSTSAVTAALDVTDHEGEGQVQRAVEAWRMADVMSGSQQAEDSQGSAMSLKSRADGDGFDLLLLLSALGPVSVKWLELLCHLNLTLQTGSSLSPEKGFAPLLWRPASCLLLPSCFTRIRWTSAVSFGRGQLRDVSGCFAHHGK